MGLEANGSHSSLEAKLKDKKTRPVKDSFKILVFAVEVICFKLNFIWESGDMYMGQNKS